MRTPEWESLGALPFSGRATELVNNRRVMTGISKFVAMPVGMIHWDQRFALAR
jgi:hypothetical protein